MTTEQFKADILPMHHSMYRLAYALLHDSDSAADAVQDCMLRLWARRDSISDVSDLHAYCLTMVRNRSITLLERSHVAVSIDTVSDIASTDTPEDSMHRRQSLAIVDEAIQLLPDSQREILKLSSFGGCSNSEIAAMTGLTEPNVRTILSRGRKKLRALFSKI
ncbi:MAG: RNA polymerase sigma factor [Muribaculaceae bacterium]|nr:RNA polymerase sigma factor [Muribaculaceae bacterium]